MLRGLTAAADSSMGASLGVLQAGDGCCLRLVRVQDAHALRVPPIDGPAPQACVSGMLRHMGDTVPCTGWAYACMWKAVVSGWPLPVMTLPVPLTTSRLLAVTSLHCRAVRQASAAELAASTRQPHHQAEGKDQEAVLLPRYHGRQVVVHS